MMADPTARLEQAAVLALVDATPTKWHLTASIIEEAGSALSLLGGRWESEDEGFTQEARQLVGRVVEGRFEHYQVVLSRLQLQGVSVVTVLDAGYPANLRDIYNRPPVLFIRGQLLEQDARAVAVVGTRSASSAGLREARHLAVQLAERGVTVLSGLARGIDGMAHEAALATGGRTIAVMGTGINQIYPPEHAGLATSIQQHGALVSQFWPDAPPTRFSFPMRNVVMSGMAIGTVVIEAGPTSGAKMQARLALDHGKRLFLVESLVSRQAWAREYAKHPGTVVVQSADEILPLVDSLTKPAAELQSF